MATSQPQIHVLFGEVDVGAAVLNVQTKNAVNTLASATFELDLSLVGETTVDYFAEVQVVADHEGSSYPLFTGNVVAVEADGDVVSVRCSAGVALTEQFMHALASSNTEYVDVLYLVLRQSGLSEEKMQLDGLDQLPVEPFEITVPVDGAAAVREKAVEDVRLLPPQDVAEALKSLEVPETLSSQFLGAPLYARAFEVGSRGYDVERRGLLAIDLALAWLAVRAKYGLARLPSGEPASFERQQARALPTRRGVVLVRGLDSGRIWLRGVGATGGDTELQLENAAIFSPTLPSNITTQDRQSVLACRRAAGDDDSLARIGALWEAIEFYVAETKLPEMFSKSERKSVRTSLPDGLSGEQLRRIDGWLGELNSAPLLARLTAAIAADGVPVDAGELTVLKRLRTLRNDAVHGRGAELPGRDEVDRAVSIVSRMLVYLLNRREQELESSGK